MRRVSPRGSSSLSAGQRRARDRSPTRRPSVVTVSGRAARLSMDAAAAAAAAALASSTTASPMATSPTVASPTAASTPASVITVPAKLPSRLRAASPSSGRLVISSPRGARAEFASLEPMKLRNVSPEEVVELFLRHVQMVREKLDADYRDLGIVFDIDDTLLRYTNEHDPFDVSAESMQPSKRLFDWCRTVGIRIILVTARGKTPATIAFTKTQLADLGMGGYELLYLRPSTMAPQASLVARFKRQARDHAQRDLGLRAIIANVGDQWTDLVDLDDDDAFAHLYASEKSTEIIAIRDAGSLNTLQIKLPHANDPV
jgi:hypothetical protein